MPGSVFLYLLIINVLAFLGLRSDKKRGFSRYKVGERTLLILSLLGGTIGVMIGMYYYKYLVDKKWFRISVPVILVIQIIIFLMIIM